MPLYSKPSCLRCNVYTFLNLGDVFTSYTMGRTFSVNYRLDCNSTLVIYIISCKVCGVQYVGSRKTKFRLRFNNHKSCLRPHGRPSDWDLVYRHFFAPGHYRLEDVSVSLIDQVTHKSTMLDKEGQWVYQLHTLKPDGLNGIEYLWISHVRKNKPKTTTTTKCWLADKD